MSLDRLDADIQRAGNLLVDLALGDQLNDLALAVREQARVDVPVRLQKLLEEGLGNRAGKIRPANRQRVFALSRNTSSSRTGELRNVLR